MDNSDGADILPNDASQWEDTDGDGFGDNPSGTNGDACPAQSGTSNVDRNGCPDADGDGVSDPDVSWTVLDGADAFENDATQSADTDGDGYGDNASGTNPDDCPTQFGYSTIDRIGCPDSDGDGLSDADGLWNVSQGADAFRYDATQSEDQDGDGYGDNASGTTPMHVQPSSVILGRMQHLDVQTAIKMVGLMSKIHTQTTQHNGRILTETDMVTTPVVRRLMHVLERTEIRRLATDMVVLTQMAMDGMMSSMNCQT